MNPLTEQLLSPCSSLAEVREVKEKRRKAEKMEALISRILPRLSLSYGLTSAEIGIAFDMTRASVYHVLHELELIGKARRKGAGCATKWYAVNPKAKGK